MQRVALTGGIGTGKSYVVRLLRQRGVPTVDADQLARAVVEPGQPALEALRREFGDGVLGSNGRLDRAALGEQVFADGEARQALEAIVHPPVRHAIDEWLDRCETATTAAWAVADIPLLYETGRERSFDQVIVVACAPEQQVQRVMTRDQVSEAAARRRLAAQLPIGEKVARADWTVHTDGSFDDTERQVDELCRRFSDGA